MHNINVEWVSQSTFADDSSHISQQLKQAVLELLSVSFEQHPSFDCIPYPFDYLLLAFSNESILVGVCTLTSAGIPAYYNLRSLCTCANYRRQGVASAILQSIEDRGFSTFLHVNIASGYGTLLLFYKRRGFATIPTRYPDREVCLQRIIVL